MPQDMMNVSRKTQQINRLDIFIINITHFSFTFIIKLKFADENNLEYCCHKRIGGIAKKSLLQDGQWAEEHASILVCEASFCP